MPACGSSASGLEKAPPSPEGKSPSRSWSTWSRCHLAVHTKAFYTRVACRLPRDHCVSKPSFSEHYLVTNSITLTSTQVIRTRSSNLMLYLLGIENKMCIQRYSINPGRSPTFSNLCLKVLSECFHSSLSFQLLSGISGLSFCIKGTQRVGLVMPLLLLPHGRFFWAPNPLPLSPLTIPPEGLLI